MAVSRTENEVETVDPSRPNPGITDGFMQSVMHAPCPNSNIADYMAPLNSNYGSTSDQSNPKSVTKRTPVVSGRKVT